jgi:pimeloyl-ACP methyl ester carboxylesterase
MIDTATRSRISAPDPASLADAQKAVFDAAVRTFGAPLGPRIPLLHSPDVAVAWSQMGLALKKSPLKPALRELAILVVGQHWRADFEWYAHAPKAAAAGVTDAQLDAIKRGITPDFDDEEKSLVYSYCRELVLSRQVSDQTYEAAKRLLGERVLIDLTALVGHFTNVAMTLNAHRVQLPPGVTSPFDGLAPDGVRADLGRTAWVESEGQSLRYRFRPGQGPTLVFVHELGGSLESWEECIAFLSPERAVLSFEWRGAGLSSKVRAPVVFDQLVKDLHQVLTQVGGAGPFVLIGVAAGAATVLRAAAQYPEQVAAVVAVVPALGTPVDQRPGVAQMAERIEREGMQAMMAMERPYPRNLRELHPERWTAFRLRYLGNDPTSYAHLLRMVVDIDLSEDEPRIQCPALVIGGSFDIRPVETMQSLAERLPQGTFEELAAGHFMPSQAPDSVARAIERFVTGLLATVKKEA